MEKNQQQKNSHVTADLDAMFQKMGNDQRKLEIDRHTALMNFTQEIGNLQLKLIQQQQENQSKPPDVDENWPSPQNVDQANNQFKNFTTFSEKKGKEINSTCDALLNLNAEMMAGLEKCYPGIKSKDE